MTDNDKYFTANIELPGGGYSHMKALTVLAIH